MMQKKIKIHGLQGLVPLISEFDTKRFNNLEFTAQDKAAHRGWWSLLAEKAQGLSAAHWTGFDRYSVDNHRYLVTSTSGLVLKSQKQPGLEIPLSLGVSVSVRPMGKSLSVRINMGFPMDIQYLGEHTTEVLRLSGALLADWLLKKILPSISRVIEEGQKLDLSLNFCGQTVSDAQMLEGAFYEGPLGHHFANTLIDSQAVENGELLDLFARTNGTQSQMLQSMKQRFRNRLLGQVVSTALEEESFPVLWEALDDWVCSPVSKREMASNDPEKIAPQMRTEFADALARENIVALDRFLGQALGTRFLHVSEAARLMPALSKIKGIGSPALGGATVALQIFVAECLGFGETALSLVA